MAIKSNIGIPAISVLTTDTTIFNPVAPLTRIGVTALNLHNTTGSAITVTLYESPNLTSSSGKEIAVYVIGALDSVDVDEVIGQGYAVGRNIIAKSTAVGVNAVATYTQYDGTS